MLVSKIRRSANVLLLICAAFFIAQSCYAIDLRNAISSALRDIPPILIYHDIKTQPLNKFDVTAESFTRQLDWLHANDYQTLTLDEFYQTLVTGKRVREKSVIITFDDGYRGQYSLAYPLLKSRNMKAIFFVHIDGIEKDSIPGYPQMTWAQLKELDSDPLFEVYSHSMSHANLVQVKHEQLTKELLDSKAMLEKMLGGKRNYLAYPFGDHSPEVIADTRRAGYDLAFSVAKPAAMCEDIRYAIPRIYMGMVMDDMALFSRCIEQYYQLPRVCFEERWGLLREVVTVQLSP